jgi:hypothetical protein
MGRVSRVLLGSALVSCLGAIGTYGNEAQASTYKGVMAPGITTPPRKLAAAHTGLVRISAGRAVSPTHSFQAFGSYAAQLKRHGIRPLPLLQQNMSLSDPQWKRAVRAFVKAVPVRNLEIGNEPGPDGWARYFQLARLAAPIIHAHGKKMILAASVNVNMIAYLRAAKAQGDIFKRADGVAIHPYARTPADVQALIGKARAMVPDRLPLWITEVGWGTGPNRDGGFGGLDVTPKKQARYIAGLYKRLLPLGEWWNLASVCYFTWRDMGPWSKVSGHSGLLRAHGHRKPAYRKYAARPKASRW